MTDEFNLTEGKMAVFVFNEWMNMLKKGEVPDCKRYHDAFFDYYGGEVESDKAPVYLMFCAFVGAMDVRDKSKESANR